MAGERILLTINKELAEELKKEAKSNLMTMQELISDILRKDVIKRKKWA